MGLESIYYVFGVHPQDDGEFHHTLKGKFWLNNGDFRVLEDHGLLPGRDLERMSPGEVAAFVESLHNSQRRLVVNAEDLKQGLYPELLPDIQKPRAMPADLKEAMGLQIMDPEKEEKTSTFDYHRTGMPAPQHLEVRGNKAFLDGQSISPDDLKLVMENVSGGKAQLRHRVANGALIKADPELLQHLKGVPPEETDAVHRAMFFDTLIPHLGNRKAYAEFMKEGKLGVHVHINGNDIWHMNDVHGHETGNQAIGAIGRYIGHAMEESSGKHARAFRVGGDHFVVHMPKHEDAALFARNLRTKLEGVPAIRGTHKLSVSIGMGDDHASASEALKMAKAHKIANTKALGQADSHIHTYSSGLATPKIV